MQLKNQSLPTKKQIARKLLVPVKFGNAKKNPKSNRRKFSRQIYNIDVEKMLCWPGNVYWKNLEGIYLGCNDRQVEALGFTSRDQWIGNTIHQIVPRNLPVEIAENVDAIDNLIMQTGVGRCITELGPSYNGGLCYYLSTKFPLRNKSGKIVGLFGISNEIINGDLKSAQGMLADAGLPLNDWIGQRNYFFPKSKKQSVTDLLSKREIECIYYLVRGMTARQIGEELDLSHRTVEFYLERVKAKLKCSTKSELIARAIDEKLIDR